MHPSARFLPSKYFVYGVLQMIGLVLLLHTSACSCNQETISPVAPIAPEAAVATVVAVDMEIPQTLLIGKATEIEAIFRIKKSESEVDIGDFKLRVSIGEQKSFRGPINGSQISYKDAKGSQQTFSNSVEKLLTEFTNADPDNPAKNLSEFKVHFKLAPAHEVIQVKIHFELLDKAGKAIKNIEVEWIKSEVVISPLTKFKEGEASFTLQNLKEDIKDLRKITVSIPDAHNKVFFLIGGKKKTEATLAELLPYTSSIAKDQETDPIKIIMDNPDDENNETAVFSILVLATNKLPIDEEKVELYRPDHLSEELENLAQEMKKLEQKGQLTKEELATLKKHKKTLNKAARTMVSRLKAETREIKEKERKDLEKLAEEEKQALIGKDEDEQHAIKEEYKRKRKEIHSATELKLEYRSGVNNAIKHNLLGIHLKPGKTPQYRQGQQAGHRISLVIGRIEATMGPTFIAVGVGTTIAAGPPTLGGAAVGTIPIAILGAIILTHGIYVIERSQTNLDSLKNK